MTDTQHRPEMVEALLKFVEEELVKALRTPRASVRAHVLSVLDECHRRAVSEMTDALPDAERAKAHAKDVQHLEAIQGMLSLYWRSYPAQEA